MGSKVQGEGDYEAGRRYNRKTREFVKEHEAAGEDLAGAAEEASPQLTEAEREALKHAKSGSQDERDAELLRQLESGTEPPTEK
jgi:hypothetical protein